MHSAKFGMTDDTGRWSILDLLPYVIHRISQKVLITTSIWKIQVAQTPLSKLILKISNDGVNDSV